MLFAIVTTAWLCFVLWCIFKSDDGELVFISIIPLGVVWAIVVAAIMLIGHSEPVSTQKIDNSTLETYDVYDDSDDVIVFTDSDGIKHAVNEIYFENGHSESTLTKYCPEPYWWSAPWAWQDCYYELTGNIN